MSPHKQSDSAMATNF